MLIGGDTKPVISNLSNVVVQPAKLTKWLVNILSFGGVHTPDKANVNIRVYNESLGLTRKLTNQTKPIWQSLDCVG